MIELQLLTLRMVALALLFGAFVGRIVPLSARLSLGLALAIFCAPAAGVNEGMLLQLAGGGPLAGLQLRDALLELLNGALLAAMAGAGVLTARLIALWLAAQLHASPVRPDTGSRQRTTLESVLLLLGIYAFFQSPAVELLWSSAALLPAGSAGANLSAAAVVSLCARWGAAAFLTAAVLAAPVFLLLVIFDIAAAIGKRYSHAVFDERMLVGARALLAVFVISLLAYRFNDTFSLTARQMLDEPLLQKVYSR